MINKSILLLLVSLAFFYSSAMDPEGLNDLHKAVNEKNLAQVKQLAANPDLINSQTNSGETPLHLAVKADDKQIMAMLLKSGADPLLADKLGKLPADYAKTEEVRNFIERASSDALDDSIWTIVALLDVCIVS